MKADADMNDILALRRFRLASRPEAARMREQVDKPREITMADYVTVVRDRTGQKGLAAPC